MIPCVRFSYGVRSLIPELCVLSASSLGTLESHPQAVLDLVSAGTKELFEGDVAMSIEKTFKKSRGDATTEHYFNEMLVNSKNLIHLPMVSR